MIIREYNPDIPWDAQKDVQVVHVAEGQPGSPNVLTIGTVDTGPAAATITGESPNQVLNLTLPPGKDIEFQWNGTQLRTRVEGGTWSNWVDLEGPQGVKGDTGNTGPQGQKGDTGNTGPPNVLTIGTVDTGPAAATITGESPNQVLNLTIPKGDTGDTGPVGPPGTADLSGVDTDVMPHEPLLFPADERTIELVRDTNGNLVTVLEKSGSTVVKETTLGRSGGQLVTVTEAAGGDVFVSTLNRSGGELVSVTRSKQ